MRLRNVEFELRYGDHRHTMRALESLTGHGNARKRWRQAQKHGLRQAFRHRNRWPGQQEELLQLVAALAFYPNLALPNEQNRERPSSECVFHTRHVPFVNLHPGSAPRCACVLVGKWASGVVSRDTGGLAGTQRPPIGARSC